MSDMFPTDVVHTPRQQPQYVPGVDDRQSRGSGWGGKTRFAGIWLVLIGVLNLIWALTALIKPEHFAEGNLAYENLAAWGWIFLFIGVIQAATGYLVLTRQTAGRAIGVIIASIGIVLNFFTLGAHPHWSIIILVMNGLVIWALTADDGELD
jgi:hypothetical protein